MTQTVSDSLSLSLLSPLIILYVCLFNFFTNVMIIVKWCVVFAQLTIHERVECVCERERVC